MALRKRHILLILALLLAFIGMATAAISIINGNVISPSESLDIDAYKISGIDVSAHNGNIDFAKARAAGTEFVFVKATEGATFRDSAMNSNLRKAHEAGLKTGVYHFFRFDVDGVKQAHNLLKAIAGRPLSLPLVIDVESHTNPYTPADIVTRKIHDMVDELTAYGYPVIIYSNKKRIRQPRARRVCRLRRMALLVHPTQPRQKLDFLAVQPQRIHPWHRQRCRP